MLTTQTMTSEPNATADAFRDSAKALLANLGGPARVRRLRDGKPAFDTVVWRAIAQAGWTCIAVPEADGGLGLGVRELLAVAEEIGRALLPEPFVAAGVHSVALLSALPPSALRNDLLADAMAGRRIIGVGWQEQAGCLSAGRIETRLQALAPAQGDSDSHSHSHSDSDGDGDSGSNAKVKADGWVVTGHKHWVVPGAGASGWLVLADSPLLSPGQADPTAPGAGPSDGPFLCWVAAGLTVDIETLARVDGSSMASLHLQRAPAQLLASGPAALAALEHANDTARLAQAAELLGVARQSYEMTLEYLKTRVQFDKPIGANQALQHRMVDAYIDLEMASACLRDVVEQHERGLQPLAALASRAKARCAEVALRLTRLAIQFHGAIGFTDEYDLGLYWKRAVHLTAWLGGAAAHRARFLRLQWAAQDQAIAASKASEELPNEKRYQAANQANPNSLPHPTAPSPATRTAAQHLPPIGPVLPPGTDWAALPEATLRSAVRAFLHAHYPAALRHAPRRVHWHEIKGWYGALSRQGWIAPAWPKLHGGMALPPSLLLAFMEEFEDFGAARMPDQGLINLGPVLIQHGTPAQQQEWLPPIIRGEHVWCQGYSEPNAGSDLASLRTEAVMEGEHFIVNGQKIWTTLAQDATHIFLLVRTDKSVKKQAGISFLLADLKTPGITVRPIRNIAGGEEFCEVFLDHARVPRANLVGQLNEGWSIAKALLGFERLFVGSPKTCQHALSLLRPLARQQGLYEDAAFCADMAQLELDLADLQAAYAGFAEMVKRGQALPPSVSLLKIFATETYTRIAAKIVEVAAEHGGTRRDVALGALAFEPLAPLFTATITTIYGGSNEIQRNILARQVLGLPS
jgi:3-oxochol-4-en-24-oyl-CoA dehydrogenase